MSRYTITSSEFNVMLTRTGISSAKYAKRCGCSTSTIAHNRANGLEKVKPLLWLPLERFVGRKRFAEMLAEIRGVEPPKMAQQTQNAIVLDFGQPIEMETHTNGVGEAKQEEGDG